MASINGTFTLRDHASRTLAEQTARIHAIRARQRAARYADLDQHDERDPNDPESRGVDPDLIHDFTREDAL